MKPPMADFVAQAEAITARHRWILLRIEAFDQITIFRVEQNRSQNVRWAAASMGTPKGPVQIGELDAEIQVVGR